MAREFSTADVERVAHLARLELSAEEKALFARQLSAILAYAQQVQDVDTSGIPAMSHPMGMPIPLREDDPRPSLSREEALAQAPEADRTAGLFKVPRVLG